MSKTDLVFCLLHEKSNKLSSVEKTLLEVNLIVRIYYELFGSLLAQIKSYEKLIKSNYIQGEDMGSVNLMQEIIRDILTTKEYSLSGIANSPQTHNVTVNHV